MSELDLPVDWTVEELVRTVSAVRGRRVVLVSLPEAAAGGLYGLCLARRDEDVILYRSSPLAEERRFIVARELACLLLGRGGDDRFDPVGLASTLVGLDQAGGAELVPSGGSGELDPALEYEAGLLATMMMTRVTASRPVAAVSSGSR
ncbi:hypothetical protein [Rhodococcus kronopolitis]|uniref:Uncharacterized protein n=1 Tax=Rhodococcus kronopolitis TaxID=1460226 RepID=A0ABV9FZS7_9NOCA